MHPVFSPEFLKDYDLVVSDFDGTLVDKSLELSQEAENFIKYINSNNIRFSIASGRPYFGVIEKACNALDLKDPQIVAAGSIIVDPGSAKPMWIQKFEPELSKEIISKLLEIDASFAVESSSDVFSIEAKSILQYGPGIQFKNLNDLNFDEVCKIVVLPLGVSPEVMGKAHAIVESYKNRIHYINAMSPAGPAYDLTPPSASKHFAVLELIKLLNIDRQKTIGIGDSYNDYPLLSACAFKIAIEGAPKELIEIADLVISREDLFEFGNTA